MKTFDNNSLSHFSNIVIALRRVLTEREIHVEGGGAAPLCISISAKWQGQHERELWFGTANSTWGASANKTEREAGEVDMLVPDDDENSGYLETHVSVECPWPQLIADAIIMALSYYELPDYLQRQISQ